MRFAAALLFVVVGCKPDPKRCSSVRATPGQCVRSAIEESAVDDPSLVRVKFSYVWQGEETTAMPFEWILPRSRLPAVRDVSRDKVECERMTSALGCPVWLLPESFARVGPPPPRIEAREPICPAGGLSRATTPLIDEAALEATLGAASGAWQRTNVSTAGVADAQYLRGSQHVRVTVRDMIHSCTGAAGSGETLLETEAAGDLRVIRLRVMSATSAVLLRWPGPRTDRARLVMWIADRCQVVVEVVSDGIPASELAIVGRVVDVKRLELLCSAR